MKRVYTFIIIVLLLFLPVQIRAQQKLVRKVGGVSFTLVRIEKSGGGEFYMAETETTQELWQAVMNNNPSAKRDNRRPVENVSYNEVQRFIEKISQETMEEFRLPTRQEWMYAAKGGKYTHNYVFSGSNDAKEVAWCNAAEVDEESQGTVRVKQYKANELGLFDMTGNVAELCSDGLSGKHFLVGGGWVHDLSESQIESKMNFDENAREDFVGFRLVMEVPKKFDVKINTMGALSYDANSNTYVVSANRKDFNVEGPLWCSAKKKVDGNVMLTWNENPTCYTRKGVLKFTADGDTVECSIEQERKRVEFNINPTMVSFSDKGDTMNIGVRCSEKSYDIIYCPKWALVTKTTNGVTIEVNPNSDNITREGEIIFESCETTGKVTVKQEPAPVKIYVNKQPEEMRYVFKSKGGEKTFKINSNRNRKNEYKIEKEGSFIKIEKKNDSVFSASVGKNLLSTPRNGLITVKVGEFLYNISISQEPGSSYEQPKSSINASKERKRTSENNNSWDGQSRSFLDFEMGFAFDYKRMSEDVEDIYLGVNYTLLPKRIGFFVSGGTSIDESYFFSGGPAFRLTQNTSPIDVHVLTGIAYSEGNGFGGDILMRIGKPREKKLCAWDLTIGCKIFENQFIPTIGFSWEITLIGAGIILTAALSR